MDLKNKCVIVTGAGSGIGRALSLRFAKEGAVVILTGRKLAPLEETNRRIADQGGNSEFYSLDITNESQVISFFNDITLSHPPVSILFNNAGSFHCIGGVWEIAPSAWLQDVTTNLFGPMLMMRYAIPVMIDNGAGIVINMNGGGATVPLTGGSGYGSSKAALLRLTETAAQELQREKKNVGVVALSPGLVRTEMTSAQVDSPQGRYWIPSTAESFAAGETRPPEDCANSAVELIKNYIPAFNGRAFNTGDDFTLLRSQLEENPSSCAGLLRLLNG